MVYLLVLNPVKKQVLAAFDAARRRLPAGGGAIPRSRCPAPQSPVLAVSSRRCSESLGSERRPEIRELQRALTMRQQVVSTVKADPEKAGRAGAELAG